MKVLVTGASGFIGARVVMALKSRGHEVAALVETGDPLRRLAAIESGITRIAGGLEHIEASLQDISRFSPEGCIHLAWYAEPGKYLHAEQNLDCLRGSLGLLRMMGAIGCRQVVMAGTCAEYDAQQGWQRENGPTGPETLYAAAKLSLCLVGQQMAALGGLKFAWGRVFYLYGPGEDPRRVIPALARAMVDGADFDATEGTQVRDYLHVDDVASGFVAMLESGASGVFNVCSGRPLAMREIMTMVETAAGAHGKIRFGAAAPRGWEPPFICGDNSRLRSLGWSPRVLLEEGLRIVVEEARDLAARTGSADAKLESN